MDDFSDSRKTVKEVLGDGKVASEDKSLGQAAAELTGKTAIGAIQELRQPGLLDWDSDMAATVKGAHLIPTAAESGDPSGTLAARAMETFGESPDRQTDPAANLLTAERRFLGDDSPSGIEAARLERRRAQESVAYDNMMHQAAAAYGGREDFIQAIVTAIGASYFKLPPGILEETSSFSEGKAVLWWPEKMSKESYQSFKEWVEFMLRKVARASGLSEEPEKE